MAEEQDQDVAKRTPEQENDREGNIFEQVAIFSSKTGQTMFVGKDVNVEESLHIRRTDEGKLQHLDEDGNVKVETPDPEDVTDPEWFDSFKDPEPGDVEIVDSHVATGELFNTRKNRRQ